MDKKTALRTLIVHSYLLVEEQKNQLLNKIDQLSEKDIDTLGVFLAKEKKIALQDYKQTAAIDQLISKLDK